MGSVMHRNLSEFRIQVYRQDGELSVYLFTPAWDVADATEQAQRLVSRVLPKAEIWSEGSLVNTVQVERTVSPIPKLPAAPLAKVS